MAIPDHTTHHLCPFASPDSFSFNRNLKGGAIINLAPNASALADELQVDESAVRAVLNCWGPGKFYAEKADLAEYLKTL